MADRIPVERLLVKFRHKWMKNEILHLKRFFEETEKFFQAKAAEAETKFENEKEDWGDHDDLLDELFSEERFYFLKKFPQMARSAMVISLIGEIEHRLIVHANALGKIVGIDIRVQDLQGSTFERIKTYLIKCVKLDCFKDEKNWQELKWIQEIRNALVHAGGTVSSDKLERYIRKSSFFQVGDQKLFWGLEFTIGDSYIPHILKVVSSIYRELELDIGRDRRFRI